MAAKTRTFEKGEEIFSEGQWAEIAYVVKSGRVEIFLERAGRKTTLGTMGPGSCFGEMAPILGGRRSASARACNPLYASKWTPKYSSAWWSKVMP